MSTLNCSCRRLQSGDCLSADIEASVDAGLRLAGIAPLDILLPDQVRTLLCEARRDREKGIYVAFPFLAGTRPSEQLGLLWQDINFENRVIHIRRMQEQTGAITDFTKTIAGFREIPICDLLHDMLVDWQKRCPKKNGELHRVFPSLGYAGEWPFEHIRKGGGNALLYANFRTRFWQPMLKKAGLPYITPHAARHGFISTLQAEGIEVGLVSKIAGHANPAITLAHYTQAVRGGEEAAAALGRAFG